MGIPRVLIGAVLLVLGRRVFWVFVAGVGFVAAITLATPLLQDQPQWLILVIALVAGVIGALLAVFLQQLAAGVAGFLAGGYLVLSMLELLNMNLGGLNWWLALAGGIIGVIMAAVLFDWALIFLSSLSGAFLIVESFDLSKTATAILFLVLFGVGTIVQANMMRRSPRERAEPDSERQPSLDSE